MSEKPIKRHLNTYQKSMLIIAIFGIILPTSFFVYEYIASQEENPQSVTVTDKINNIFTINDIINFSTLTFHTNSDSLEWKQFSQSSYNLGNELFFSFKITGLNVDDPRKISVFLIDNNNFVRMTFPNFDNEYLNNILSDITTYQDMINNESGISIIVDRPVEIKFSTEKIDNILSFGNWHVVVLVWKEMSHTKFFPSVIITDSTYIKGYEKPPTFRDNFISFIAAVGSLIFIALLVYLYFFLRRRLEEEVTTETKIDIQSRIYDYLIELIKKRPNLTLDYSTKSYIRFFTKNLDFFPKLGEEWTSTKRVMLFQFINSKQDLDLFLHIGPGLQEIRQEIYKTAKQKPNTFNCIGNRRLSKGYFGLYKKNILTKNEYKKEISEINKIIEKKLTEFYNNDLPKIENELIKLRKKYTATPDSTKE